MAGLEPEGVKFFFPEIALKGLGPSITGLRTICLPDIQGWDVAIKTESVGYITTVALCYSRLASVV